MLGSLVILYHWKLKRVKCINEQLIIFEDLEVSTHKTKNLVNYVAQMENTKKVLLVDGGPINEKLKLATQNLHYVNVLPSIVSYVVSFVFSH